MIIINMGILAAELQLRLPYFQFCLCPWQEFYYREAVLIVSWDRLAFMND